MIEAEFAGKKFPVKHVDIQDISDLAAECGKVLQTWCDTLDARLYQTITSVSQVQDGVLLPLGRLTVCPDTLGLAYDDGPEDQPHA